MAKKNQYYVVWKGRLTGIFSSWDECNRQVSGFPGAVYKGFTTRGIAERAMKSDPDEFIGKETIETVLSPEERRQIGKPIIESVSVDAACNSVTGDMEYRGVFTKTKKEIFREGPFRCGTNNIGEFLAIVHALGWLKQNKNTIPVYTDSLTALTWVGNKRTKTKLEANSWNHEIFDLIARAEKWLQENSYSNRILKWETRAWGENPADFGRK